MTTGGNDEVSDQPVRQEVTVRFPKIRFTIDVEQLPDRPEGAPVTTVLTIGGGFMPANLSIDDTTESLKVVWVDDKGDTDAAPPDGAQVTYGCDNEAVATADPSTGKLTLNAEGSANGTVDITGPDGGPLLEPDGVTPFSAAPVPFTVVAGPAATAGLQVQAAEPAPPAPTP